MKNQDEKINLTGLNRDELSEFVNALGEKPFRARQLFSWIYEKKACSFIEMTDLSLSLRQKLSAVAEIGRLSLAKKKQSSASGSTKYLFLLKDGYAIESVYIPKGPRHTLCISSQVGCRLGCLFCATGQLGYYRDLDAGEIVDQVIAVERDKGIEITNVVFMGMGEPFLNYDQSLKAAALINDPDGLAIGARHIVISTVGIIDGIRRFTEQNCKYKLAISLHAVSDCQIDIRRKTFNSSKGLCTKNRPPAYF